MAPQFIPLEKLGQVSQGITPSRYADDKGTTYRVISIKDLENLYIEGSQGQAQMAVPNVQRYQLLENDIVIAIRGVLLKSSVVTAALQGSVCNQNTVFFRAKREIDPLYLAILFRSHYFEQLVTSKLQRSSTTLAALRISDLRELLIPVPVYETQKYIAQLFLSLEQLKKVTLSAVETRQKLSEIALFQALEM